MIMEHDVEFEAGVAIEALPQEERRPSPSAHDQAQARLPTTSNEHNDAEDPVGEGNRTGVTPSDPVSQMWDTMYHATVDRSANAKIWRTYVAQAEPHDTALFVQWKEGVDVFLLFTGLFSAILSAFLIASWSTLQPDNTQAALDGLVAISHQLVLLSSGQVMDVSSAYRPAPFVQPWWAAVINGLWFTSLFISLFAAILAMLLKEWLAAYSKEIPVVPIERVLQRQFRYEGLMKWAMPNFFSLLPLSIHLAVFLFLSGLVVLAWPISIALAVWMAALLLMGFCLYVASAIAPVIFPDCPYKSPLFLVFTGRRARRALSWLWGSLRSWSPYEARRIERDSPGLLSRAVAWLVNSPDQSVQADALHFLGCWRPPNAEWTKMRVDVQSQASSFMWRAFESLYRSFNRGAGEQLNLDIHLERAALVSTLLGNGEAGLDVVRICREHGFVFGSVPMSVNQRLMIDALNCLGNVTQPRQAEFDMDLPADRGYSIFGLCSVLEATHIIVHSLPVDSEKWVECVSVLEYLATTPRIHNLDVQTKYVQVLSEVIQMQRGACAFNTRDWQFRYGSQTLDGRTELIHLCLRSLCTPGTLPWYWQSSTGQEAVYNIRKLLLYIAAGAAELRYYTPAGLSEEVELLTSWALSDVTLSSSKDEMGSISRIILVLYESRSRRLESVTLLLNSVRCLLLSPSITTSADQPNHAFTNVSRFMTQATVDFVAEGSMQKLISATRSPDSPFCLPVLVIGTGALLHNQPSAQRSLTMKTLLSAGWLDFVRSSSDNLLDRWENNGEQTADLRASLQRVLSMFE